MPPQHERFFAAGRAHLVDDHDRTLWESLHLLTEGGKRFRPALLLRVHEALGDTDRAAARVAADAVELLHTALVIHDDVLDGDEVRRGRLNVGGTFAARATAAGAPAERARHYGEAAGILAGDLALAGAVRELALCGAPRPVVTRLLDLLEVVLHRSAAGELADVRLSLGGDVTLEEALDVAAWKTAAYSFELPLQAGAILAGADERVLETLGRVGRSLGVAFQLQDDLNGVFGTAQQTGKDPLCDLREGKSTALIAFARGSRLWPLLAPYVGDPDLTAEGAQRARELLVACGAKAAVEAMVNDLHVATLDATDDLPARAAAVVRDVLGQLLPPPDPAPLAPAAAPPALAPARGAA